MSREELDRKIRTLEIQVDLAHEEEKAARRQGAGGAPLAAIAKLDGLLDALSALYQARRALQEEDG